MADNFTVCGWRGRFEHKMKYCKELTKEICGYLEEGMSQRDACEMANVADSTFHEWLKRPEFSEAIKKAILVDKKIHQGNIKRAAQTQWQASAWWLERKFRDEFKPPTLKQEVTGENGAPLSYSIVVKQIESKSA